MGNRLEAATLAQLDQAPLVPEDKKAVYGIFQREDQAWERAARGVADSSANRDTLLHESYRHYVEASSQELCVKCQVRFRWPVLHAAAREAAAL